MDRVTLACARILSANPLVSHPGWLILPSIDLAAQDVLIGNAVQALSSQHTDLYLRHIQPTPVFGSVVYLQARLPQARIEDSL